MTKATTIPNEVPSARSYQLEMLEQSLQKRNVLVCMDTGSGKTMVALLRIRHELAHNPDRMVWFLCPTVPLSKQQEPCVAAFLPDAETRLLTGQDSPELWSTQDIWDRYLKNVNVVVCTYETLRSAVTHGFVSWNRISLLVVDEAHHAQKKHPLNKLMATYLEHKRINPSQAPAILGLSASPEMRGDDRKIRQIEDNMCCQIVTPTVFRDELLQFSNRPEIRIITAPPEPSHPCPWQIHDLRITADSAEKAYDKLKQRKNMIKAVHEDLGPWAAQTLFDLLQADLECKDLPRIPRDQKSLPKLLRDQPLPNECAQTNTCSAEVITSEKFRTLLKVLRDEFKDDSRVIVFAKTRAAVRMLSILLNSHPDTRKLIKSKSFVSENIMGGSQWDFQFRKEQMTALEDLREGRVNVLVSTTVLEEGIDVSSCNIVVCFDDPSNFKAFIQRRGRARTGSASMILITEDEKSHARIMKWLDKEEQLSQLYQTGQRFGAIDAPSRDYLEPLIDPTTGAKLEMDDAVSHLYHFCAMLPRNDPDTPVPLFTFYHTLDKRVKCRVLLPGSVNSSLRETESVLGWPGTQDARKDASFAAYKKLYKKGLVNENLLPLPRSIQSDKEEATILKVPSLVFVAEQWSPWPEILTLWNRESEADSDVELINLYWYAVTLTYGPDDSATFDVCCPKPLRIDEIALRQAALQIKVGKARHRPLDASAQKLLLSYNHALMRSAFNMELSGKEPHSDTLIPVLIAPSSFCEGLVVSESLTKKIGDVQSREDLTTLGVEGTGIVRDLEKHGKRYVLHNISAKLGCSRFPKSGGAPALHELRRLIATTDPQAQDKPGSICERMESFEFEQCSIERMPLELVEQALILPYLLRAAQLRLTASRFFEAVHGSTIQEAHLDTFVEAIVTPAAAESFNYQRLELFGDTILKFLVATNLSALHPHWHEGCLSELKHNLVSNAHLQQATLAEHHIPPSMISDRFQKKKYCVQLNDQHTNVKSRLLPSKTLADGFEAILAAFYVTQEELSTLGFLKRLLPGTNWMPQEEVVRTLQRCCDDQMKAVDEIPTNPIEPAEKLIGICFNRRSLLLEALTHQSSPSLPLTPSYERLEFIGDALLELIVTETLFASGLKTSRMHSLREAVVNRHFQAFCVFETVAEYDVNILAIDSPAGMTMSRTNRNQTREEPHMERQIRKHVLTDFMRFSPESKIPSLLKESRKRFESVREEISQRLWKSERYPWRNLIALRARKTSSDVFEAALAAVYLDSGGSKGRCIKFLERFGVMQFLRHAIEHPEMALLHPKEELAILTAGKTISYESSTPSSTTPSVERIDPHKTLQRAEALEEITTTICVDGSKLCSAQGWSIEEAETAAADQGIEFIKNSK